MYIRRVKNAGNGPRISPLKMIDRPVMSTRAANSQFRKRRRPAVVAQPHGLSIANNPVGILALLSLFLLGLTGAYWHTNGMSFNLKGFSFIHGDQSGALSDEARDAIAKRHVNNKFVMGGVHLGMTEQMVKDIHPLAQSGVDRAGEPVMTIPTDNGMMVAWLFSNNEVITIGGKPVRDDLDRIYRLRLDQAFASLTEHDILKRYGHEYGRPLEATCTRAGQGDSPRCAYRWWGGDGIEVQAIAKKKADLNGRLYTQLTTIATNTIKSPKMSVVSLSTLSNMRRRDAVN